MPIPEAELPVSNDALPEKADQYQHPETQIDPEVKKYRFCFDRYIVKDCRIDSMDGDHSHSALKVIRDLGMTFGKDRTHNSSEIREIKYVNQYTDKAYNEFSIYYKNLEDFGPDVEIYEVKVKKDIKVKDREGRRVPKTIDYRIFFFTTPDHIFHIRSINDNHKDDHKGKH